MFAADPAAKSDMKAGTLYAIAGESDWIYYGQITSEKRVGFFKRRDRTLAHPTDVLGVPIMSEIPVAYPSIGRALREGKWKKLGRFEIHAELLEPRGAVNWPVGTVMVSVWRGSQKWETRVEDPAIQEMEVAAAWDAIENIPERLTADFGVEAPVWHVGGPIWRERRVREEFAMRFPDAPWHALPEDWVPATH